jgi:hypothetical protein
VRLAELVSRALRIIRRQASEIPPYFDDCIPHVGHPRLHAGVRQRSRPSRKTQLFLVKSIFMAAESHWGCREHAWRRPRVKPS